MVVDEEGNIIKKKCAMLDLVIQSIGQEPWLIEYLSIQLLGEWEIEQQYESFLFDVHSQSIKRLKCKRKRGMDVNIDVSTIEKSSSTTKICTYLL